MSHLNAIFRPCAIVLAAAVLAACATPDTGSDADSARVRIPPRVDLGEWPTIGIVTFEGAEESALASEATRAFIEMVHDAQPAARIVELGHPDIVLAELGHRRLDFQAARAMGERYGVDAVFLGLLELSSARPRVDAGEQRSVLDLRARVDLAGELAAKLLETGSGALVWSRSASGEANVANLGLRDGRPTFGAQTPAEASNGLVEQLVSELRHDFHPSWQ